MFAIVTLHGGHVGNSEMRSLTHSLGGGGPGHQLRRQRLVLESGIALEGVIRRNDDERRRAA